MFNMQKFAGALEPTGKIFVNSPTARLSITFDLDDEGNIAHINNPAQIIAGKKTYSITPTMASATPDDLWYGTGTNISTAFGIVRALYYLSGQIPENDAEAHNIEYWKRTITQETANEL